MDEAAKPTIYALASARGKAGVAVVRISGTRAFAAVAALTGRNDVPRRAVLRQFRWNDLVLDQGLVLLFAEGASFTGEAVAELHLHGSTATINAVLGALSEQKGLRLALPGEFSRRALENGRLDLAQIEGLADLIDAETEAQRRQALRVLSGAVGVAAERWRRDLIRAASLLEATIDFVDEAVPVDVGPEVLALLDSVLSDLHREAAGARVAERVRDGFEVAIVGAPNVGKSTLLNALAGREAAITSEVAGTTRDVIEVRMDIDGLPVTLLDTAGLRSTSDPVEEIGIRRAVLRANDADLRVFLTDGDAQFPGIVPQAEDIFVQAKADIRPDGGLAVSGKTGAGITELVSMISSNLGAHVGFASTITRERHRIAIVQAITSMESARAEVGKSTGRVELAADDLRNAIRALDALVGRVDVENLLDEIFSSFCIGK